MPTLKPRAGAAQEPTMMRFNRHNRRHWVAVAAVTAASLFTLSEAWGQSTGSAAVFEGRPAMAGAQAGQGAMAGPPQGGISPQGSDGARGVELRPPSGLDPSVQAGAPAVPRDPGVTPVRPVRDVAPQRDRDPGSLDKQDSATKKVKRAAKRTLRRERVDPLR
jgi:hypothetical protein